MRAIGHNKKTRQASLGALLVLGLFVIGFASCRSPQCCQVKRTDPDIDPGWPRPNRFFTQVCYTPVHAELPVVAGAEFVKDDEICQQCHEVYGKSFAHNVHRGQGCEGCHGPASKHVETRGKVPGMIFSFKIADPVVKAEACLKCHEQDACAAGARWRESKHAHCGVTCTDCHRGHYNVRPGTPATKVADADAPADVNGRIAKFASLSTEDKKQLPSLRGQSQFLGAVAPYICYRCHCDKQDLQTVAHPHQICGPNGFNCTTCHDPHGKLLEASREELCLKCHTGAPTMAWHSAIHHDAGVRCTDCHNPHPNANVQHFVEINHSNVRRAKRLPMSVDEPEACFKCHPKIFALFSLPSHHPVREGKMVCSDCHDPHGQKMDNLKEPTVNLLCYKCHGDKQGPFAFEHPPVRENCEICHNPHGAVANNLLKQSLPFLCLRCHPGHNAGGHPGVNLLINPTTNSAAAQGTAAVMKQGFYTDCTQCHQQIHGTDRLSQRGAGLFMSR